MIDGLCASVCTIVLAALPRDKICVTSKAKLVFHAAWDIGIHGRATTNLEATRVLYAIFCRFRRYRCSTQTAGLHTDCLLDASARPDSRSVTRHHRLHRPLAVLMAESA
jgi:hypothetical protein